MFLDKSSMKQMAEKGISEINIKKFLRLIQSHYDPITRFMRLKCFGEFFEYPVCFPCSAGIISKLIISDTVLR